MGRPSLQDQRRKEILAAFLEAVAAYGVEGATLERIASKAGLKRPLIRHHLGNRADMVQALADHVCSELVRQCEELRTGAAHASSPHEFVDMLFSGEASQNDHMNAAYQALVNVVELYPELRAPLLGAMRTLYDVAYERLRSIALNSSDAECRVAAHGIVDLFLAVDSMGPLNPPDDWAYSSYHAARRLADTLA